MAEQRSSAPARPQSGSVNWSQARLPGTPARRVVTACASPPVVFEQVPALQPWFSCVWRMGGARRRADRDSLSLPHGHHERAAVAGCVRKRPCCERKRHPRSWPLSIERSGAFPAAAPEGRRLASCMARDSLWRLARRSGTSLLYGGLLRSIAHSPQRQPALRQRSRIRRSCLQKRCRPPCVPCSIEPREGGVSLLAIQLSNVIAVAAAKVADPNQAVSVGL